MEFLKSMIALMARLGIPLDSDTEAEFESVKNKYDELLGLRAEGARLDQRNEDLSRMIAKRKSEKQCTSQNSIEK